MTLWERFVATAPDREVAGYFERAPNAVGRSGLAVSFERPDHVETLTRTTNLNEVSRQTEHCLSGPRSAVMGYVGFDAVGLFEPALARFPAGSPFPLGELAFVREARIARTKLPRRRPLRGTGPTHPLRDSLPLGRFGRAVRHLVSGIREGEAFQVVLSHRREWRRPVDLLAGADRLRATERFAFFYYLKFGDREIVGATPESVVEVRGDRAFVNPIAGTLPTGSSRRGRLPLAHDPKELAEHRMLVDLARNDLGSVSRPGSVRLVWEERRFRYARLEHLVSRVAGRLRPEVGPWNALAAAFPAGTVSGAPKVRALEIIRELEPVKRGIYSGAVGYIGWNGNLDTAIAIRTAVVKDGKLHVQAGAGIVHDSVPVNEWRETLNKARALMRAVEMTRAGNRRGE